MLFGNTKYIKNQEKNPTVCMQLHDILVGTDLESKWMNNVCPVTLRTPTGCDTRAWSAADYWKPTLPSSCLLKKRKIRSGSRIFSSLFSSTCSFGKEELRGSCTLKRHAGFFLQLGQGKTFVLCIFLKISPSNRKNSLVLHFPSIRSLLCESQMHIDILNEQLMFI